MKGLALLLTLAILASCARSTPSQTHRPEVSASPSASASRSPAATASPTPEPRYNVAYVAVSVATVWTYPSSPRSVDAPALAAPAHPRTWVEKMTNPEKLGLVGRVQTQILYGTKVYLLATSGPWTDVAVADQPSQKNHLGYPGWVPTEQLTTTAPPDGPRVTVSAPTAWTYDTKSHDRLIEFSYGTSLHLVRRKGSNVEIELLDHKHADIASGDVTPVSHDVIKEARRFLGLPYLWGGTSGFGYDCSGFSYSVYRALGIHLARDTDQQMKNGRAVPMNALRPGDILFVADATGAIVHDAIYYGTVNDVPSIIESPHTGKPVRIVPFSTHRYIAARRVLPS